MIKSETYGLYESYEKLFSYATENNKEVLFDWQFIKDTCPINVFTLLAPYIQSNDQSSYVPTKALVDMYETLDGKLITDAGSGYNPATPCANQDTRLKYPDFLQGDVLPSGNADAIGSTYIVSTTGFNVKKMLLRKIMRIAASTSFCFATLKFY